MPDDWLADNRSVIDQQHSTSQNRVGYWMCAAGMGATSILTVLPERWLIQLPLWYIWVPLADRCCGGSATEAYERWRHRRAESTGGFIVITAPLALFYICELMLMMIFFLFTGFAP
jgi:hypothetical protein